VLVSLGIPGGIAGLAGAGAVWLAMRRGRRRLEQQLQRLQSREGNPPEDAATAIPEQAGVVERHHNRYVPYEVTQLDRAWAAAHARVGERYPGAVPYLKIVEGVKDQLLSGSDEIQLS
jgi:hypothetical protein